MSNPIKAASKEGRASAKGKRTELIRVEVPEHELREIIEGYLRANEEIPNTADYINMHFENRVSGLTVVVDAIVEEKVRE